MQRHEVRLSQQFIQIAGLMHRARQHQRVLNRQKRVVAVYVHLQRVPGVGNHRAYRAQANYSQLLALQLRADEVIFALFD